MVLVGAVAVNRDPAIWGLDADQWNSERWFKPLPEIIDAYLPGVYSHMLGVLVLFPAEAGADGSRRMAFMDGGRSCM